MDIVIALLLAFVTAGIAFLGIYLTIHPPQTPSVRSKYLVSFILLAVGAIGLTGWQTYRSATQQNELQAKLDSIEKSTKQPPTVQVTPQINIPPAQVIIPPHKERSWVIMTTGFLRDRPPPFTSKNSFAMNVGYRNMSNVPARIFGLWTQVYRFDHLLSLDEENKLYAQLRSAAKSKMN